MSEYALAKLVEAFEIMVAGDTKESKDARYKLGEYPYIALAPSRFEDQLKIVAGMFDREHDITFVDVGCGLGTKLVLARHTAGIRYVVGIEKHPKYVRLAKKLLRGSGAVIIKGDALDMDYGQYDIIYFYCPLRDHLKQQTLEARIIETMKPGAFVMAHLKQSGNERWTTPPMRRVWGDTIYQKEIK